MPNSTTFKLSAETGQFVGEVGKATKSVDGYDNSAKKAKKSSGDLTGAMADGAKKFGAYAAAAAAAGAAITAALVKTGLESVDALAKTSDKLGVSTEALASLRHAANLTGVETGKFDVALQRMTRRLADAASGSGPAVDAFKALGLSAGELIKLSPDQAFSRIADQMNKVENQSQKVSLAFKLFDSEGVGLVNTLALGSEGLARLSEEAEIAGIAISRIDAAKVEAANDAMFRVGQQVTGLGQQLAVQFAPVLEGIAERLFGIGKEAGGMARVAEKAFNFMVSAVGQVGNAMAGVNVAFNGIVLGLQKLAEYWAIGWDKLLQIAITAYNAIPLLADIDYETTGAAKFLKEFQISFANAAAETKEKIDSVLTSQLPSDAIKTFVDESKRQFEAQAIAVVESQKMIQDEVITTAEVIEKTAKTTVKKTKKPIDEFAKAWEKATERIDNAFASAWEGAFDGFSSFRDSILDAFKRLLAELAHLAITKPILVQLGLGGGSAGAYGGSVGASAGSTPGSLISTGRSVLNLFNGGVSGTVNSFFGGAGGALHTGLNAVGAGGYAAGLADTGFGIADFFGGAESVSGSAATGIGALANIGAGYAGNWAGNNLGEGLFGKQAESNIGSTVGAIGGSIIGGPLGAFIGGTIGSALDVAFGGDGKKRTQVGVSTDPNARSKYVQGDIATAESGLSLAAINLGTGGEGIPAAKALQSAFLQIDSVLLDSFETLTGSIVDLSGDVIGKRFRNADGSRNNETQYDGFFGGDGFNGINAADLKGAPDEFVRKWVAAANAQLGTQLDFSPIFDLAADGELLADTLLRVNTEFVAVNAVLGGIGATMLDLTTNGLAAADGLVQAFGGLDNLVNSAEAYYSAFYTQADQFQVISKQVTAQFEGMNLAIPDTRAAFKDLVESLNLTTVAGQDQFAALLQLSPAMNQYYSELERLGSSVTGLADTVGDATDDLLKRIINSLNSAADDLQLGGSDAERKRRQQAQNFVQSQINAGEITDAATLESAISILSQDSAGLFGSSVDYQRDLIRTRNSLKQLSGILGGDVPQFASGGLHSGGLRVVGEGGPELEFTGPSRIVRNSDMMKNLSNEDVVQELRALRAEVRSTGLAVAKNTMKSHKVLQKWDIDGLPLERTA